MAGTKTEYELERDRRIAENKQKILVRITVKQVAPFSCVCADKSRINFLRRLWAFLRLSSS